MSDPKQDLIEREQAWMEAIQRKDVETIEDILAPEYAYAASGQGRRTRQQWLAMLPIYDIHQFTFTHNEIQIYGETAVVLVDMRQEASVNGEPRSGQFLITDVWTRRDGRWQVVARSSILMPPAP
jgi:ketosteroid isomerase-like protein